MRQKHNIYGSNPYNSPHYLNRTYETQNYNDYYDNQKVYDYDNYYDVASEQIQPVKNVNQKKKLNKHKPKKRKIFNSYFSSALITMIAVGVFGFFVYPGSVVAINGTSMMPNLHNGDKIFASRFPLNIKRFDIVIVSNNNTKQISDDAAWIKRVIGLPGETVQVTNNKLYINGKEIKQPFKRETTTDDFGPVTLQDDEYWVMGDNRANSCDSRYVGVFKKSDIKYKYQYSIKELSEEN